MANKKPKEEVGGSTHIYAPIGGKPDTIGGVYGENRGDHIHAGYDIDCPVGSPCIAPVNGKIVQYAVDHGFAPGEGAHEGGGMIQFEFLSDLGPIKAGDVIGWGHVFQVFATVGESVEAGQKIASSGETTFNGAEHVHFIYQHPHDGGMDGSADPAPIYDYLRTNGQDTSGFEGSGGAKVPSPSEGSLEGGASAAEVESISKAAAFNTFINLPTLEQAAESLALKGERSLMNDKPLMSFIEQLCTGSLRQFMSMPNGNFYAFLPDYFGGLTKRTAYWQIEDIEILDGKIELSDDALATHVYVAGDSATIDGSVDLLEKMQTAGVVTVFNAFMANFITGGKPPAEDAKTKVPSLANKDQALAFLQKYGARPFYQEAPMIRSHFFEMFLAYQMFCLLWSKQFVTTFEFTFMPELFPGGLVRFPNHGIQCYIDEVRHEGDYEKGFRTLANLSSPTALKGGNKAVHEGMVRSAIMSPAVIQNPGPGHVQSSNLGQKHSN